MRMRVALPIAILCCTATLATLVLGRLADNPGYKQMSEQADLIVIATPTGNADLPGTTTLPNITSVDDTGRGHEIPATRVESFPRLCDLCGLLSKCLAAREQQS